MTRKEIKEMKKRWREALATPTKPLHDPVSLTEIIDKYIEDKEYEDGKSDVLDKIRAEIEPKCDRINSLASVLPYAAHREIQELLCEIMDLCKAEEESGIKYLNINVSNSEVERNPDIVRLCADAGVMEYVKPKTGHWIEKDGFDGDTYYNCSECGESWTTIDGTPWQNGMDYCPHCGAKMESEESNAH